MGAPHQDPIDAAVERGLAELVALGQAWLAAPDVIARAALSARLEGARARQRHLRTTARRAARRSTATPLPHAGEVGLTRSGGAR